MVNEVEIFFQKCILTLQTMSVGFSKPPTFAFFFIFWIYRVLIFQKNTLVEFSRMIGK